MGMKIPTRTLLSFMITSLGGSFEDMICFIPISTLNSSMMKNHFLDALQALNTVVFNGNFWFCVMVTKLMLNSLQNLGLEA